MSATENQSVQLSFRDALTRLIDGLRRLAVSQHEGVAHIGGTHASHVARAAKMRQQAGALAEELEGVDDATAARKLVERANFFSNLDLQGTFIGKWSHVATMIAYGAVYVISGGILCQSARAGTRII